MSLNQSIGASAPAVFTFRTTEVRTFPLAGEVWFVASDVAKALAYGLATDMTRNLDDDEKGMQIVHTPSGDQEMIVINESGLYHAMLKSRKPEAKPFRKWVTAEVLPAIRKTGSYARPEKTRKSLPGALTIEQQDAIKQLVKAKADQYPQDKRGAATIKLWSALKSKFGVGYKEIPAEHFTDALSLVARLEPLEGEVLGREDAQTQATGTAPGAERIRQAYDLSAEVAAVAARTVFEALLRGDDASLQGRWLFGLGMPARDGNAKPWAMAIDSKDMVVSMEDLPRRLLEPNGMMPSNKELAELAAACNQRLAKRMACSAGMAT